MHTRVLANLIRIAQVGSFQTAASQLNMTLSALSMQMKALESELAVDLFDRSVRPPRLTPLGRAIVERARDVVAREAALLELCVPADDLVGTFRIGFVTSAAARLLPVFLHNAQTALKRAQFTFETGLSTTLQDKVRAGSLDAAVVTGTEVNARGLRQVVLRDEPFVFAAHASIAAQGVGGLMAQHRFFHFMPQTGIGKLVADAMRDIARPADAPTVVLDSLEAIMGCVKAGLGFTLLPAPDVARYADESLTLLPPPRDLHRSLVLVTRAGERLSDRVHLLVAQFG